MMQLVTKAMEAASPATHPKRAHHHHPERFQCATSSWFEQSVAGITVQRVSHLLRPELVRFGSGVTVGYGDSGHGKENTNVYRTSGLSRTLEDRAHEELQSNVWF